MPEPLPQFTFIVELRDDGPELSPTLGQIISQDIGFAEHVEVLLVGPETSERLLRMRERHPKNMRLIAHDPEQAVGAGALGVASPKSDAHPLSWIAAGLREARGAHVSFITNSAIYGSHALTAVKDFISAPTTARRGALPPAILVAPVKKPDPFKLRAGYEALSSDAVIADLDTTPDAVPIALAGLFVNAEWLRSWAADSLALNAVVFDEALLALEITTRADYRLGYVCEVGAHVQAAVRRNIKLQSDQDRPRLETLLTFLERESRHEQHQGLTGGLHPAMRSAMLLLFTHRLARINARWFADEADARALKLRVRALLDQLSPAEIHSSQWVDSLRLAYLLDSAVFLDRPWKLAADGAIVCRDERILSAEELPLEVMRVNARPDEIEIEVLFHDFHIGGIDLEMVSGTGELVHAVASATGDSPKQRVAEQYASVAHYRRFLLPVGARASWRFVYKSPAFEHTIAVSGVRHNEKTAFARDAARRRILAHRYRLHFTQQHGYRVESGRGSALLYKLRRVWEHAREFRHLPWSLLASSSSSRLILINDRAKYGNDNGEALFRYIQAHRPELRKRTWFVLDEQAPSYAELTKTRRVVQPLTFAHRRIYLNTRLHLSSHAPAHYNSPWSGEEATYLSDFADPTFIWLRHGITMNSVDNVYNRFNANLDGIVASAHYERDYLLRPGSFFTDTSLVPSGLPRFDLLQDRSSEQSSRSLLYLPTWRVWLAGAPQPDGSRTPVPGFEQSDYFVQQKRLMTDPDVTAALHNANARFEFLVHPVMAGYQSLYESLASDTVIVRNPATVSYSELFAAGSGMITDYSSVFVDFTYMRKPVVFDQSDAARFRDGHYQKRLFDYETSAPGPVVHSFEALKHATLSLIASDFEMERQYEDRLAGFFLHNDAANAQRALDAGIAIDERRRGRSFNEPR